MLFLLDANVRTVKWNGIPLHESRSAIVKEEVNGDFILTVRYPITDSGVYQLIKEDMLIKAPVPVLGAQLFRIKKPIENDDSLDITAYHVSDDIMKRSITPVSVVGQGCAMALSQMVQNAKTGLGDFSFTSDIMDSRTFNTTETETLYSVLMDGKHSIVGTWEGELVRDNFALSIKRSRGADRGVVITTHKNLKSYQRTKNSQGVVTRIYARSTFKPDGAEDEVTLRVTVDSPLINSYPYINEKEYENNNAETVEDLRKWAEAKFTNEGIDKVSDAIEIEAYELDGQVVHLGDTVNLKSRKHSADLYKKAIAYEFNALTEEYISITFDDKPGVGGSGVSSGLSNAADAILGASATAQDVAIQRAVKNANAAFDAEFDKAKTQLNDDIERTKAKVEVVKSELTSRLDNQLLPVASEAKGLALKAQAALVQSQAELQGLTKELTNHRQTALAQIAQVKAQALSQGQQQAALTTQIENAVSGLATFKQTVHQELATFNRLTETVKGRIDQVESQSEQTAAGFKTSLKALETYTALEPTRASRYFEASKTETARQLTALRTEVSGSYVAKSTYEENARGVARRFESLSSGGQNYALGTEKDVYVTVSSDGLFDLYDFGATLAVKGVQVGDTVTLAFNYFTTNKTAFGSYEIELHGHSGKIQRLGEVERTVLGRGTYQVSFVANPTNYLGTSLKIRFTASQLSFRVTKLRLTKGSIAADWSPAPDDMKAYSDQKLIQFRSQFEQTSSEIKANVESLSNQTLKKADVSITSDGIVLKAGKSTSDMARAIGSSFAVTPDAIRIFSNLIKVSGNMLVDGSVTSRKLVTGAVETGHIKAGAITGYLLSAEAVSAKHVKVDQALFTKLFANEAYVRQLFAKTAFITQVQAVDISANRVKGGLLAAINGATKFNLQTGALDFYTDSPALRRVLSGYPTQFIRFTTGTSNGKKTGVTIIGSNRNGTESSNDGGFVGVRCWNGNSTDQIDIVGDVVRLASSAFDNSDGWSVKTLPGKLEIDAHRSSDRPSSKLNIGDVNLFRTATNYTSLKDILQQFNINFKHLANITGRGDVISTWETIK
ncbi:prophage LambdaSa2, PblB [Streptococcus varani]|uniref:Prophage LambdaSa2, PblB n=1 Tax=Streptococcus varani TaxID=1608583 RepID=A0A0E4CSF1_9STRE|nr:phage tail spike protein [Streptococcus varani]CQR24572.1 prophage LambdaSa2, PblB [Streptococcus varani]